MCKSITVWRDLFVTYSQSAKVAKGFFYWFKIQLPMSFCTCPEQEFSGEGYKTKGPLVNLLINKNMAGDINFWWNLLIIFSSPGQLMPGEQLMSCPVGRRPSLAFHIFDISDLVLDWTETCWKALWLHGDSELLKSFRYDIQNGRGGHIEILQTTSSPRSFVGLSGNLMGGIGVI